MLYENEYIVLSLTNKTVIMQTKKSGYPLKSFDKVTQLLPRLRISSFPQLRQALSTEGAKTEIGIYAPEIDVVVSVDNMRAEAEIFLSKEELIGQATELPSKLHNILEEKGIVHGILDIDWSTVRPRQTIQVAKGTEPVKGRDAQITYIQLPERRPVIREDGSANYYEMNFVTAVKKGDWLGEKIPAQEGEVGYDVFGNEIPGSKGIDSKLVYDRKSIEEVEENGKTVLRASNGGVLEYQNGTISIGKQLVIEGNVGPETGSITFDGTVVITGTVLAGYSVNATGDISIGAKEGVTNAKEIRSESADIYIQGGIFGGGSTVVEAHGTIFIKHANDCCLYANTIQVGLYLLGSHVIADYVYVDRHRGKIIGGKTEGLYRIECATAGNQHERSTMLIAKGIDKEAIHIEVQQLAKAIKEMQKQIKQFEIHMEPLRKVEGSLAGAQREAYDKIQQAIDTNYSEILTMDEIIQSKLRLIKNAVIPQIEITNEAHAGVIIQVGSKSSELEKSTKGVFELTNGLLNV